MTRHFCDRCENPVEITQYPTVDRTYHGKRLLMALQFDGRNMDFCQSCVTYLCGELVNASQDAEMKANEAATTHEPPDFSL